MCIKLLLNVIPILIPLALRSQHLVDRVNPFIGTANHGNTNPGAVMPWEMISLSPFNSYDSVNRSAAPSPYIFGNKFIYGFTHLNLSGVGCPDLGTFYFMPVSGAPYAGQVYKSEYSDETATPGYYSVNLDRYDIKAELSTTLRTSISCYTFPQGESHIILNLGLGLTAKKGAAVKQVSDTEIDGFKNVGNFCGLKGIQTVYFVARISKQPVKSGVLSDRKVYENFQREIRGDDIGAFFSFNTKKNEKIYKKVGVSYVSVENARLNLNSEQCQFDFEGTRQAVKDA